jgi:glutamate synthase (NADPH/NADH) small chain
MRRGLMREGLYRNLVVESSRTMAAAVKPPAPPKLNPVRVPIFEEAVEDRVTDFREILHAYSPEDAVLEGKRCIQCRRPWCVEACPISQDCREYILKCGERDFDGAARVTLAENPLATSLCKVCYRYCEDSCVVKKKGVPIAIRHLKRASLELGRSDLAYVPSAPVDQRIAVVGGGPAGMMRRGSSASAATP